MRVRLDIGTRRCALNFVEKDFLIDQSERDEKDLHGRSHSSAQRRRSSEEEEERQSARLVSTHFLLFFPNRVESADKQREGQN